MEWGVGKVSCTFVSMALCVEQGIQKIERRAGERERQRERG